MVVSELGILSDCWSTFLGHSLSGLGLHNPQNRHAHIYVELRLGSMAGAEVKTYITNELTRFVNFLARFCMVVWLVSPALSIILCIAASSFSGI